MQKFESNRKSEPEPANEWDTEREKVAIALAHLHKTISEAWKVNKHDASSMCHQHSIASAPYGVSLCLPGQNWANHAKFKRLKMPGMETNEKKNRIRFIFPKQNVNKLTYSPK